MNKLLLTTALTAACSLAAFAAPAFAQAASGQQTAQTATAATPAPAGNNAQRPVPAPGDRTCIRDTGSHIPPPKGQCLPVAGTSYSHQDIQRTGATDVGHALQMLDPSVQVRGH